MIARLRLAWMVFRTGLTPKPPTPPPQIRYLTTDEPPVDREQYLTSWQIVLPTTHGHNIVGHLRYRLWYEASKTVPLPYPGCEQAALWQARRDGRLEALNAIILEATDNLKLLPKKQREDYTRPIARASMKPEAV